MSLVRFAFFFLVWSTANAGCIQVSGDRIRGADLVAAGLDADPNLDLGPAPLAGLKRVPRPGEPFAGNCFELRTAPLTSDAIQAAMTRALGGRDARIEIVDFSRMSVPDSTIEFPLATLAYPPRSTPDAPVLWRGRAVCNRHSLPIWARVKIVVETTFAAAAREIAVGHVLTDADLVTKTTWEFPRGQPPTGLSVLIGLAATRRISVAERIDRRQLITPNVVDAGQLIEVRVVSAGAQLRATAIAERAGKLGETIMAKNDQSGKRFRARITGPAQAVVVVGERF